MLNLIALGGVVKMIMQILTDDMILEDIKEFEKRIQKAKGQLSELPETAETWQARKNLKEKRRILTSEIEPSNGS